MTPHSFRSSLCRLPLLCGAGLAVALTAPHASAALSTWKGTTNTDWNTAGNWAPATVPTSTIDAYFAGSVPANQPTLSASGTADGLRFDSVGWTIGGSGQTLVLEGDGINGSNIIATGTISINTDLYIGAQQYFYMHAGATLEVNGAVSSTTGVILKLGNAATNSGTVSFNATSSGFAGIEVQGVYSNVNIAADNVFGTALLSWDGPNTLSVSGSHSLGGSIIDESQTVMNVSGTLSTSGSLVLASTNNVAGTRTLNVSNGSLTVSGLVVNGTNASGVQYVNGINVNGSGTSTGTLVMATGAAYTGSTIVTAGSLLVQSGSLSTSTSVTVAASGTLGTGKSAGGGSFNTLNVTSMLLTGSTTGSTLLMTLGNTGAADNYVASGSIGITGGGKINLVLNLDSGATLSGNYILLTWTTGSVVTPDEVNLTGDSTITTAISNGSYVLQDVGNSLELVAVPEPSTLALAGCGVFMAVWGWRKRKPSRYAGTI